MDLKHNQEKYKGGFGVRKGMGEKCNYIIIPNI